jgi:hypothetical protein
MKGPDFVLRQGKKEIIMTNQTKASQMDSQELLEYYYRIKAEYERCISRKWNPYKTAAYEARIELIRRGLK